MSGKLDQASHEAAIARIALVLPHAKIIRMHLSEILDGNAFRGSRRSQEFLSHVVECALARQWERLKERSLGIDLFSRDASYDTGGDSIVRVTASDVRRRLTQHYSEHDGTSAFRIEMPAGSYIPEFAGFDESPRRIDPTEFDARSSRLRKIAILGFAACLGCVLGAIATRWISGSSAEADSRYRFYRELLGPIATDPARETEVALSNPHLLLYVGSDDPSSPQWPSSLNARVPAELETMLNPAANDIQARYPYHFLTLADEDYTGLGEAVSAFNVGQLMRRIERPVRLTQTRFLNWGAARNTDLILLGAPHMSSWAQESLGRSNFGMEHDAITNARPLPGENKVYSRSVSGNVLDDYGLIWMARLPSGSRQLLIAGLTSAGTAGVGDFFCDPDRMRPIYEKLRATARNGPIPSDWQLLLHIHARQNVPLEVSFVSLRADVVNR